MWQNTNVICAVITIPLWAMCNNNHTFFVWYKKPSRRCLPGITITHIVKTMYSLRCACGITITHPCSQYKPSSSCVWLNKSYGHMISFFFKALWKLFGITITFLCSQNHSYQSGIGGIAITHSCGQNKHSSNCVWYTVMYIWHALGCLKNPS